ncbi:NAD(P)-binding protein [Meredithblackwellia eburnea MCA 4105]
MKNVPSIVNFGILGSGRQGVVHANAIFQVGAPAHCYAVYDLYPAASQSLSDGHPHRPRVANTAEEIIDDPNVHAIIICTPNSTHADLVKKVAAAGKVLMCEKPLDSSLEKIEDLLKYLKELEKTRRLPFMSVGLAKRYDPTLMALRHALQQKTQGQLELLLFNMRDETPQPTEYMKHSGGMINDTCVHEFDLARYLLDSDDEFDTVFAHGSDLIDRAACAEAKDVMRLTISIKTRKGVLVTLQMARRCVVGNDQRVEAQCALGDYIVSNPPEKDISLLTFTPTTGGASQRWKSKTAERYAPSFTNQIKELMAAVLGGGGPLPPGVQIGSTIEDGWMASRTVAAAQIALTEGRMVKI